MAYDEALAERIRQYLADEEVREQKMFGGLAFLLGGHMTVAASGRGGIMVRVGEEAVDTLLASTTAERVRMGGRPMKGWLRVPADELEDDEVLATWVDHAVAVVRKLPPKA